MIVWQKAGCRFGRRVLQLPAIRQPTKVKAYPTLTCSIMAHVGLIRAADLKTPVTDLGRLRVYAKAKMMIERLTLLNAGSSVAVNDEIFHRNLVKYFTAKF
jgi:hypothetical protein